MGGKKFKEFVYLINIHNITIELSTYSQNTNPQLASENVFKNKEWKSNKENRYILRKIFGVILFEIFFFDHSIFFFL